VLGKGAVPGVKDVVRQWRLALVVHDVQNAVQPPDADTVRSAGPAPYRVLLLGGGVSAGLGVSRRVVALPGHLARHLTAITGRGVEIDVDACVGMTVSDARSRADQRNLRSYDAIVTALGVADALAGVPAGDWRRQAELLLAGLLQGALPTARVVVVGLDVTSWSPYVRAALAGGADRRMREYNAISRELCWGLPRASYLRLPGKQSGDAGFHTVRDYDRFGRAVAAHLAPRLERLLPSAPPSDDEAPTNLMFSAQGLSDLPLDAVVDRVLARVRSVFGVEGAALTPLRDETASSDEELPEPSAYLAGATAVESGGLSVRNLRQDPRFQDGRLAAQHGMAFYAGYGVQTPSGDPVAVLSIFDPRPRTFSGQEMGLLRDHALLIERALARGHRPRPAARLGETLPLQ
jgi:hypothetical protein